MGSPSFPHVTPPDICPQKSRGQHTAHRIPLTGKLRMSRWCQCLWTTAAFAAVRGPGQVSPWGSGMPPPPPGPGVREALSYCWVGVGGVARPLGGVGVSPAGSLPLSWSSTWFHCATRAPGVLFLTSPFTRNTGHVTSWQSAGNSCLGPRPEAGWGARAPAAASSCCGRGGLAVSTRDPCGEPSLPPWKLGSFSLCLCLASLCDAWRGPFSSPRWSPWTLSWVHAGLGSSRVGSLEVASPVCSESPPWPPSYLDVGFWNVLE